MSAFQTQLDILNQVTRDTFGRETITYQPRLANADDGASITLKAIPLDPIRLEGQSSGQFTVRWVTSADLEAAGIAAKRGDRVSIPASAHTLGGVYVIHQVQKNVGGGINLVLNLLDNRLTGANQSL